MRVFLLSACVSLVSLSGCTSAPEEEVVPVAVAPTPAAPTPVPYVAPTLAPTPEPVNAPRQYNMANPQDRAAIAAMANEDARRLNEMHDRRERERISTPEYQRSEENQRQFEANAAAQRAHAQAELDKDAHFHGGTTSATTQGTNE